MPGSWSSASSGISWSVVSVASPRKTGDFLLYAPQPDEALKEYESINSTIEPAQSPTVTVGGGGIFASSPEPTIVFAAFIHGLRSAAGHQRLVIVNFSLIGDDPDLLALETEAIEPASLGGLRRWCVTSSQSPILLAGDATPHHLLKLFAGQTDPHDPARFTMAYQTPDGSGTVEGVLGDDDIVRLKFVDGPLLPSITQPATGPSSDDSTVTNK